MKNMRRWILRLGVCVFIASFSLSIYAEWPKSRYFTVMLKDGSKQVFFNALVGDIHYSYYDLNEVRHDEYVSQEMVIDGVTHRYLISDVVDVSFNYPTNYSRAVPEIHSLEFDGNEHTRTILLYTNTDNINIRSDKTWLTVDVNEEKGTLTIKVPSNESVFGRKGHILISAGNSEESITVYQLGLGVFKSASVYYSLAAECTHTNTYNGEKTTETTTGRISPSGSIPNPTIPVGCFRADVNRVICTGNYHYRNDIKTDDIDDMSLVDGTSEYTDNTIYFIIEVDVSEAPGKVLSATRKQKWITSKHQWGNTDGKRYYYYTDDREWESKISIFGATEDNSGNDKSTVNATYNYNNINVEQYSFKQDEIIHHNPDESGWGHRVIEEEWHQSETLKNEFNEFHVLLMMEGVEIEQN